jgi:hypothetical protein
VVTVLLGAPPADRSGEQVEQAGPGIDLDSHEQAALAVLAGSGLVPPLRLIAAAAAWPSSTGSPRPVEVEGAQRPQREGPGEEHPTAV